MSLIRHSLFYGRAKGAFLINAFLDAAGWPRLADSRAGPLYYRESSCGFLIQISQHNLVNHVFNTILISSQTTYRQKLRRETRQDLIRLSG
jgi:hypothetical protein